MHIFQCDLRDDLSSLWGKDQKGLTNLAASGVDATSRICAEQARGNSNDPPVPRSHRWGIA
jgi:hypothetical protein